MTGADLSNDVDDNGNWTPFALSTTKSLSFNISIGWLQMTMVPKFQLFKLNGRMAQSWPTKVNKMAQ